MKLPIRAEYDNSDSAAGGEWYSLIDANNEQLLWKRYNHGSQKAMSDDAEYITNAVNSHGALVEALGDVLSLPRGTSGRIILETEDEAELKAVLAAAKGADQ